MFTIFKHKEEREAVKVRAEVERRQLQALKSGIPQLINSLYHYDVKYYPSWIKIPGREYVPKIVESAIERRANGRDVVELVANTHPYTFFYTHPSVETGDGEYLLELYTGENRVLAIRGHIHNTSSLDAYIKGDWVDDFYKLRKQIEHDERIRKEKEFRNPKEINQLKKDFGIK